MRRHLILGVSVVVLAFAGLGWGGEALTIAQKRCPISGKPVDGTYYVDVDGFRILTAGDKESEAVRKDPGKVFSSLAKNKDAALPVVWKCPSMLNPVTPNHPYVQQGGKRIYYCCAPCKARIQKDFKGAAATMKKLAEE